MAEAQSYNVTSVIDHAKISGQQWLVLLITLFSAMFDGYDTQGIAYVAPVMAKDLGFSPALLGPIFSSGLAGLTLGAVFFGMLADKIGRKQAIIWPMAIFGVFSLATPLGHDVQSLVILRFLAGFGLGGTLPNVTAYVLEYAPRRRRALLVNSTAAFFAFGSIISGSLANILIPTLGWQSTFYIGGIVPLLSIIVVALYLPESVRYLLVSGKSMERVADIMRRIVPERNFAAGTQFTLEPQIPGITVKALFTDGRAYATTMLWIAFVANLFILTYLVFWLPTLLRQVGQPLSVAITVTICYAIGGLVGGLGMGWLADKLGSLPKVLATAYGCAAVTICVAAFSLGNTPVLIGAMFLTGCCINGGQGSLNTISAIFYPTAIRATGIGWALGVGRIGAVIGPAMGGILLQAGFAPANVVLANVVPAVIGVIAIALFHFRHAAQSEASIAPQVSSAAS
ncbi:MAG TPA: MFS transporter [Stellaceae bacterium]|jgi:AAHS family 4-hydroxybenzoate transporter-like MFS transporter|nr:MFS transporter [Stellaceae bacterium]